MLGRVALVTGGTRGIGLAIAEELAKNGAKVAIMASNAEAVSATVEKLSAQFDTQFYGVSANVADLSAVEAGVKAIESNLGTIEILINNAGITRDGLLMRMSEENWDAVINVNLKGVFNCTKSVYRSMFKNRFGRIVNIASVVGLTGNSGQANYAAAKAGIIGFTKTIAKEGAAVGILCNAVAPGFIDTQMIETIPEKIKAEILKMIPLGKLGQPADVAKMVAFLAADTNKYITGQVISVDGGLTM
jgi:3-oxoacyl-[acyl-carrier protein] reductase